MKTLFKIMCLIGLYATGRHPGHLIPYQKEPAGIRVELGLLVPCFLIVSILRDTNLGFFLLHTEASFPVTERIVKGVIQTASYLIVLRMLLPYCAFLPLLACTIYTDALVLAFLSENEPGWIFGSILNIAILVTTVCYLNRYMNSIIDSQP
jgi:hypothetical protein